MKYSKKATYILKLFDKNSLKTIENKLRPVSQKLVDSLIEQLYEKAYQNKNLSLKEKQIATLASVISIGDSKEQIIFQGKAAFNIGISRKEVEEILMQVSVFSGFTRAINAAILIDDVYKNLTKK